MNNTKQNKRFAQATWQIMEQLLEVDSLEEALSGSLEIIVKERGTTVVTITHNAEIAKMADRVIKLRSGKIASIKRNLHPLPAAEIAW